ncbi:MAG: HEAT repeat domain-containing protein, partial [Nitrososphaera sp.]|nr:HEAT repeat domain-containing protein [Nitrososphaera sp.]
VGFSIVRLMNENSFYGSHFSDSRGLKTLEEILYGTAYQSHKREHDYWDDPSFRYQKVQKDIAVLFRFQPHVTSGGKPEKVAASNIGLSFDQMDLPIVWLGGAKNEQSIELLVEQYKASTSIDVKSTILGIVSWHEQSQKAYGLLRSVLSGNEAEQLRKKAALQLGEFEDAETLELLEETAETDRSAEVAERAVLGIARMDGEAAVDALIRLAKSAKRDGVRKKAVHSLTRYASDKIIPTLQDIVINDKDLELQKQAVYALSRMKREDYIPQLINIAKTHPLAEIRKHAIHMLGQSKDQRALDALIDLVKQ